ncbi:MAG: hypothetical protein AB7G37_20150 [Solirubrobacteraceae bacterium]
MIPGPEYLEKLHGAALEKSGAFGGQTREQEALGLLAEVLREAREVPTELGERAREFLRERVPMAEADPLGDTVGVVLALLNALMSTHGLLRELKGRVSSEDADKVERVLLITGGME